MCFCDDGYFGIDCSLMMCPKGDDPLTQGQSDKQVKLVVTGDVALSGYIGVVFYGKVSYLPLTNPSNTSCVAGLQSSRVFGTVQCVVTVTSPSTIEFWFTISAWPIFPAQNNVYVHYGDPPITAFSCDTSQSSALNSCNFTDVSSGVLKG